MQTVYDAAGGRTGLEALARAWHERVLADEVVGHAFSHGYRPDHVERLAAYWVEALGGPPAYSSAYDDESFVVREHSGNGEHEEMNDRAIACFDGALADVGISTEPLRSVLHDYFAWATRTTMYRHHESADDVPEGLTIPHWSWDGLAPDRPQGPRSLSPRIEHTYESGVRCRACPLPSPRPAGLERSVRPTPPTGSGRRPTGCSTCAHRSTAATR